MQLNFKITNQMITCMNMQRLVCDSINFVTANFTFDASWGNLAKIITFTNKTSNITKYAVLNREENQCYIPWEVLTDKGNLIVYVEGTSDLESLHVVAITHMTNPIKVIPNEKDENASDSLTPTQEVYQQILSKLAAMDSKVLGTDKINSIVQEKINSDTMHVKKTEIPFMSVVQKTDTEIVLSYPTLYDAETNSFQYSELVIPIK